MMAFFPTISYCGTKRSSKSALLSEVFLKGSTFETGVLRRNWRYGCSLGITHSFLKLITSTDMLSVETML